MYSYIAHFLPEINKVEVAGNGKFIKLDRLYTYIFILFHIFIIFNAFYNMKPKIFGCFINLTVILCQNE